MKFQKQIRRCAGVVCLLLAMVGVPTQAAEFAIGADLSFLKQAEERGKIFKDGTNALPGLQIFKNHGYNWIRLRVFVEPVSNNLPNDLAYTIAEAQDAKKLGYKFLLDFHYANSWADPGKQPTPGDWIGLTHQQRAKKVFEYTRDTIAAFRDEGVLPDMVQVGNEVTVGMLWPDGKLPAHWDNFADYLRAGIKGVRSGTGLQPVSSKKVSWWQKHTGKMPVPPTPRIMIHTDTGGNVAKTKWFFDNLKQRDISFDVIGLSYYPRWHGTLMDLRENLAFAASTYGKDVMIVETGYNWRPGNDFKGHATPFPETPEGQRDFLDEVTRIALQTPGQRCKGIFWWEPATGNRGGGGRGFFDEDGNSLPVLNVFDKYALPLPRKAGQ
jgi:arabinogalactan endo-1,4-beta-galactosidase